MFQFNNRLNAGTLAYGAAFLLIGASAAQGLLYGYETGSARSTTHGLIFAAGSAGGAGIQPYAFLASVEAARAKLWLRAFFALLLGLACLSYNFTAGLGFVATARGDMTAERGKGSDVYRLAKTRYDNAERDLAALEPARAAAELAPIIGKLRTTRGVNGCQGEPDGPISRNICGQVADLEAEGARAQRRAELTATMGNAEAEMRDAPAVGAVDPQAAALAAYFGALGWKVSGGDVGQYLILLAVAFFELGAALSLVVARALQPVPAIPEAPRARNDDRDEPPAPPKQRGRKRAAALGDVLGKIKANGGKVEGQLAGIGRLIGTPSRTTTHRTLHELANLGLIRLTANTRGMAVQCL